MKKILYITLVALTTLMVSSCREDVFTESIFDTDIPTVDQNSATAPFDQWLEDNFRKPFNTEINYKFNLTSTSLGYQLAPSDYKKSQLLSQFIKYLFYDVYNKYGEKDAAGNEIFMRKYGPRIFQFIGSKQLSASTGTETLGYASGGVKITLINVNEMKIVDTDAEGHPTSTFSGQDVQNLNYFQFHTMHHEFSHIMHQTKTMPVTYAQVTPAGYVARDWQKTDSITAHNKGFTTHYAQSSGYEDFVETLSCVITNSDICWMFRLVNMCANGGYNKSNKEEVYTLIDSLGISKDVLEDPNAEWNKLYFYNEFDNDGNPTGMRVTQYHLVDSQEKNNADDKAYKYGVQVPDSKDPTKMVIKEGVPTSYWTAEEADEENQKHLVPDAKGRNPGDDGYVDTYEKGYKKVKEFDKKDPMTFAAFMDSLTDDDSGEVKGMMAFLKKLEIATTWYTEEWGLHLFEMRKEVRERQDNINEFLKGITIYELQ